MFGCFLDWNFRIDTGTLFYSENEFNEETRNYMAYGTRRFITLTEYNDKDGR
jgi:hypothetical protein